MRQMEREELESISKALTEEDRKIFLENVPARELFDEIERRYDLLTNVVANVINSVEGFE